MKDQHKRSVYSADHRLELEHKMNEQSLFHLALLEILGHTPGYFQWKGITYSDTLFLSTTQHINPILWKELDNRTIYLQSYSKLTTGRSSFPQKTTWVFEKNQNCSWGRANIDEKWKKEHQPLS